MKRSLGSRTVFLLLLVLSLALALAGPAAARPELAKHTFHDDLTDVDTRYWRPYVYGGAELRPDKSVGQELVIPPEAGMKDSPNFGAVLHPAKNFTIKADSWFSLKVGYKLTEWVSPSDVRLVLQIHYHDRAGTSHVLTVGRTWVEGDDDIYFVVADGVMQTGRTDDWDGFFEIERSKSTGGIGLSADNHVFKTMKVTTVGAIDFTLGVVGSDKFSRDWPVKATLFGFDVWSEKGFNTPKSWKK